MFRKKNREPLLVVVGNGRYDCYGPDTPRFRYLTKVLKKGGPNHSVPDGRYHFNVQRIGFRLYASLIPIED